MSCRKCQGKYNPRQQTPPCTCSTPESAPPNNSPTSSDNAQRSDDSIQPTPSLPTSPPELIGTGEDSKPFWNSRIQALSKKWLSHIETGYADSLLNSSNTFSPCTEQSSSWFTHTQTQIHPNWLKTSWPSARFSHAGNKDAAQRHTKKRKRTMKAAKQTHKKRKTLASNEIRRCRSLRMFFNQHQHKTLIRWLGAARFAHNWVVADYQAHNRPILAQQLDISWYREERMKRMNEWQDWHWIKSIPYSIFDYGLEMGIQARNESISRNLERFNDVHHSLSFQSRKQPTQTILIRVQNNDVGIKPFPRFLFKRSMMRRVIDLQHPRRNNEHLERARSNHSWPNEERKVECDSSLTYNRRLGKWWFNWSHIKRKQESENQASPRIVAMDPGVRTFQTYISNNGSWGKIGHNDMSRIYRLLMHLDDLVSRRDSSETTKKQKRRMTFALARARRRIKNLIDEMHKQTTNWLVKNFDVIVLPHFNAGEMSRRLTRRLRAPTVRKMLGWAHSRFRTRVLDKCAEYENKLCIHVNEAYTSKTCSRCGEMNWTLGGREAFRCAQCHWHVDRDLNGALNIMFRALLDTGISLD